VVPPVHHTPRIRGRLAHADSNIDHRRASNLTVFFVVDHRAGSGQYMVMRDIGQGPHLEDVLFPWRVTGHYRYFGAWQ
jgi:uncharacterized protein YijF (DUF1287 family)